MKVFTSARQVIALGLFSLFLAIAPQSQATSSYTSLVVFGDSLSDSGNIFDLFGGAFGPNAPYTEGRFTSPFTNGDPGIVWVEQLANLMEVPLDNSVAGGTNYAFGGATAVDMTGQLVPSLFDQVGLYLSDLTAPDVALDESGLFVVFAGGNDVLGGDDVGGGAAGISGAIMDLYLAGARNFLVPNLPDIGLTPGALALDPAVSEALTMATLAHNAALAAALDDLSAAMSDINLIGFDIFSLFESILANPAAFGLTNVDTACAGLTAGDSECLDPDSFLFFDNIHPTAITHMMMGNEAFEVIKPIPIPAALPLMLSALGLLGWRTRRA